MGKNRSGAVRVWWQRLFLAVGLTMALAACGGEGSNDAPALTTTSAPAAAPTTAAAPASTARGAGGQTCASLAARAADLFQRWRSDMRCVAGPQYEQEHRAEARALVAQARGLGCPVPSGAEQIIDG